MEGCADTYKTIAQAAEGVYKDKGSKFIALVYPVYSEDQVKELLLEVKKKYYDARHHCYAYVLGIDKSNYRLNDDGEPSGTAGRPIYGQIQSSGLTNILIIVVRYFGGIKLGVRGLINAYKGATKDALSQACVITKVEETHYSINFEYLHMNEVMKVLKDYKLDTSDYQYNLGCSLIFSVRNTLREQILHELCQINGLEIEAL